MAVNKTLTGKAMIIKCKVGVDKDGKDIFRSQRFSKIKSDATDEALFAVGDALAVMVDAMSYEILNEEDYQLIG